MNLLEDTRILDLTQMLAGPYASMILADLGADIIKIEEPKVGDRTRTMAPHFFEGQSAYFISINRNKKSLTLDLKKEKGREIFYKLAKKSDVVFDNFRPETLKRLGCDYERLQEVNPKIISCSLSAYGSTGPYKNMPAFDLIIQALGGAMSITGEPEGKPVRMGIPMGDLAGGTFAAFAIASALYARQKTGQGCKIDLALLDTLASLLTYVAQYNIISGEVPKPIGSGHQSVVPYQAFKTKDIYIVIAVFTEKFWGKLCRVLGCEELSKDPRFSTNEDRAKNRHELLPILERMLSKKTGDEWVKALNEEGVPCAPINTVDRVLTDEQILAREMVVDVPFDSKKLRMLGNPVKVIGATQKYQPSPTLSEHNDEILKTILGYSDDEIKKLKEEGII